jgi:two-component system sensor histidine kinase CpxA
MIRPASSLLTKILCWFFLNLALVAIVLAVFFTFQSKLNLHTLFRLEGSNRLQTTSQLISHDLGRTAQAGWPEVLARHGKIHQVEFALLLEDGTRFTSAEFVLPRAVGKRANSVLRRKPPRRPPPPHGFGAPRLRRQTDEIDEGSNITASGRKRIQPRPPGGRERIRPSFMLRTRNPTRYWAGIRIPIPPEPLRPPTAALLLAVSDSITGHGFFFDPIPWIVVAAAVLLVSALLWIPMVRNITRPLTRMTVATEEIAKGRFDIAIHESRGDEIGRLAKTINRMASRLSAFVTGQKRFLGDVAHELGSPIARIQFGLGALEQRVDGEHRNRVLEVMEDVDHMSRLVNELLAFSRADMRSKTVKLERIDLLPVVQAAVKRESKPAAEIITEIDPGIRVLASSELLTRALANLVRNAIKYAADAGPIYVGAEEKDNSVKIVVQDSGTGVREDLLDQLFEPFFRPEASRGRDSGGAGLGLAIVKTCVETCKGTVTAANLKPHGFAVTISLNV